MAKTKKKISKATKDSKKKPLKKAMGAAQPKAKAKPKRARGRPKEEAPTLAGIKAKIKKTGVDSLNAKEARALTVFQKLARSTGGELGDESNRNGKDPEKGGVAFDLKKSLADIEEEIFDAYMIELKQGKGIARIQAADRLRDWADDMGVNQGDQEAAEVSFLPITVNQSGKVVAIETA